MSELISRNSTLEVPNAELLTRRLGAVIVQAECGALRQHAPQPECYWKSLDLVHVALHLNGARVWDVDSETGGSSITPNRRLAEEYLFVRGPLTVATVERYLGVTAYPSTKLLVGLGARLREHSVPATHFGNEGKNELITSSMKISDLDPVSQLLVREVFELTSEFDTEFVRGHD